MDNGCTKIALRIDVCLFLFLFFKSGEKGLMGVYERAREAGLESEYIRDAGRTQIAAGSMTVVAVFGDVELVNSITGKLKLL